MAFAASDRPFVAFAAWRIWLSDVLTSHVFAFDLLDVVREVFRSYLGDGLIEQDPIGKRGP